MDICPDAVLDAALERLRPLCGGTCDVGLILGSGLGAYAARLEPIGTVPYEEIPGFPVCGVAGHAGRFVVGRHAGRTVLVMQGRFHYYEGHPPARLALGVRAMRRLGVDKLLLTNAAGGVNLSFSPGTLMVISDHINYARVNPLIGPNDEQFGPRFPDQSNVYDRELRQRLHAAAEATGVPLAEGVYMMFPGPCFETPAEIRMARLLGADAVGMSTVPEAIAATHCGMRVLGLSLITNMAAGILDQPLTHEEVQATAAVASRQLERLVDTVIERVF